MALFAPSFLFGTDDVVLKSTFLNCGGRIMMFVAGAATEGPGMIVTPLLKDHLRSHHDIDRDSAKHFKRASKVNHTIVL